jgi:hypothetical protein
MGGCGLDSSGSGYRPVAVNRIVMVQVASSAERLSACQEVHDAVGIGA